MKHLSYTDAIYFQEQRNKGLTRRDAAVKTKEDLGLEQTISTIVRTCPELIRIEAGVPDIENRLPEEMIVNYEDCVILGDMHMPYVHKRALMECLSIAKQKNIKTVVLNGDALDFDWASNFMSMATPGTMQDVEFHRRAIYDIVYALSGVFNKIYITRGNHDERLLNKADKLLSLKSVWHMFACPDSEWLGQDGKPLPNLLNICKITERFYMKMLKSPTGDWLFCHQKNYSVIPGRVAGRLAAKEGMNVIAAHEHHLAIVTDGTNKENLGVSGGCMFDEKKVEYKQMRHTLHPKSSVGWVILEAGIPTIYNWNKLNMKQ